MLDLTKGLSNEEKEYFAQILKEFEESGTSDTLKSLWEADYDEMPTTWENFISDPEYLGKIFIREDGSSSLFKYWRDTFSNVFKNNEDITKKKITEVCLSGAIGLGKTTIAVTCMLYMLHRLLCLKNPQEYFELTNKAKIAIAFFNINLNNAYGVGYTTFHSYACESPWFQKHGRVVGKGDNKTYYPGKNIEIVVGSLIDHFLGRAVYTALLDELNFDKGQNEDLDKSEVMKLYMNVAIRSESRFLRNPGLTFLVSSKNHELDFLEQYINKKREDPNVLIIDEPQWVVLKDKNKYSGETFPVLIGNRYISSKILGSEEEKKSYLDKGYNVIDVPVEHREKFEFSLDQSIQDIAGIAISSSSKFFMMDKVISCCKPYLSNPFTLEILELGFDDSTQISDFLLVDKLPKLNREYPHYIHWDASIKGDITGLSMMTKVDSRLVKRLVKGNLEEVTDNVYKVIFAIGIKSYQGQEIPFYKIRNFIYYLKSLGFNIANISNDSFQSRDNLQTLKLQGFNTELLSVDRSTDPYFTLRNAVNEGRLIMPRISELEKEFSDVEWKSTKSGGKIDHSQSGHKDILDTIAANIYKLNRDISNQLNSGLLAKNWLSDYESSDDDLSDDWILPKGTRVIDFNK